MWTLHVIDIFLEINDPVNLIPVDILFNFPQPFHFYLDLLKIMFVMMLSLPSLHPIAKFVSHPCAFIYWFPLLHEECCTFYLTINLQVVDKNRKRKRVRNWLGKMDCPTVGLGSMGHGSNQLKEKWFYVAVNMVLTQLITDLNQMDSPFYWSKLLASSTNLCLGKVPKFTHD